MPLPSPHTAYNSNTRYNANIPYNGQLVQGMAPLCDPPGRLIEFDVWITPDGIVYSLHSPPVKAVLTDTGTGLPPMDFITQRGPYQHGVTLKGVFLQPRVVQMVIRQNGTSRTEWYKIKNLLMDALRPNRTPSGSMLPSLGILRKYMPNGSFIDLYCLAQKGPVFEARSLGDWDEWSISETIQFFAPDPLYYGEDHSVQFADPTAQLVFPITFPILFGALDTVQDIDYLGDWPTFPTITFTGPATSMTLVNESTGEKLSLNYTLGAGQSATFSLPYGLKTVTLNDGTNLVPYLTSDSDLATFHLAPIPEVPNGVNTLHAFGVGSTPSSVVSVQWVDRYVGLKILGLPDDQGVLLY